jgi:hypothetical protein
MDATLLSHRRIKIKRETRCKTGSYSFLPNQPSKLRVAGSIPAGRTTIEIVIHRPNFWTIIDIDSGLDELGRKRMPEVMEAKPHNPGLAHRRVERLQEIARIP